MHSIDELERSIGSELSPSAWFRIDQERVDRFAVLSLDQAWTHTDPVRAAPLGGTTVQGLLLLSLVPHLLRPHLELPEGCTGGVNYGFDRLRFTSPVRVGKRVRARATLLDFSRYADCGWKKRLRITIDIEDVRKPALHGDWTTLYT